MWFSCCTAAVFGRTNMGAGRECGSQKYTPTLGFWAIINVIKVISEGAIANIFYLFFIYSLPAIG